jgi:hypothetical protein
MKKFLVLILGIALFACTQKQKGFNIQVQLEGAEGKILIEKRGPGALVPVDTADIVEGVAMFWKEWLIFRLTIIYRCWDNAPKPSFLLKMQK